ncbi:GntR family transcriptional regulator [Elioraea tepidiphila]|jgi:DNA-binding GntR family transcriptional regulator|uniref:GntR family transcriptional regulator n=1 Tax=Elioraea tepidiphila TaxID=457934 RepID=UPI000364036C|nr:GntR family transcriptional regulator [Elioraea tepidiphila]
MAKPTNTPRAEPGHLTGAAPRLHERTFDILAARIAEGALPAGTLLLESHLARQFGISRAPARQALARLELLGLVRRAEGHGYRVRGRPSRDAEPAPLTPVRLEAAASWQRFYPEVERAIIARTAVAGWRVIETELARHYGVSRTVAREMIARLNQRGVIRRDGRGRWYAPALTPEHVGELYELRWLLEPVALRKAMPSVPSGFVSAMRRRLEEAAARAETLDGRALDELEADLHLRLLGHCTSRTLMDSLRLYQSLLVAHSFLYDWVPRLYPTEPFLPEHLAVVTALEAGDIESAAAALEQHLRASLGRALARIAQVAEAPRPAPLPYLEKLPEGSEDRARVSGDTD